MELGFGASTLVLQMLAKHAFAGAFDENLVRAMVEALDRAWATAQESGAAANGHAEAARELLALRIIEIAQLGERDPGRLRDDALAFLARKNLKSPGP